MVRTELTPAERAAVAAVLPADLAAQLAGDDAPEGAVAAACEQLEQALGRIGSFVSPLVAEFADGPGTTPDARTLTGTLMLASFSGFQRLVGQRGANARQGSEQLGQALSALLGRLFAEVQSRGGAVVRFGPSSIMAFFDSRQLGSAHAPLAVAAAQGMQAVAADSVDEEDGQQRVQLRIALHAGKVFAITVGDAEHAELIVSGHTVARAERLLASSSAGECALTDEVIGACEGLVARAKVAGVQVLQEFAPRAAAPPQLPQPRPEPGPELLQQLARRIALMTPFLPRSLGGPALPGAEQGGFRPVTVVSATSPTLERLLNLLVLAAIDDPLIVAQVFDSYYTGVQRAIHAYGGSVTGTDLATSSNRLQAIFGVPLVHEDDPLRAVRAVIDLRAALDAIGDQIAGHLRAWAARDPRQRWLLKIAQTAVRLRVGIASGNVFTSVIGTPARRHHVPLGETMQLAPRLLSGGSGPDVVMSSAVYRVVRHVVQTRPLPPITIEEVARPIPVYQVIGDEQADNRGTRVVRHDTPMIGRDDALARLLDLASAALSRGPESQRVVAITGTAGAGKSRLAEEVLYPLYLVVPTVSVCHAYCYSYERSTPYRAAGRLLRQVLRLQWDQERAAQAADVQRELDQLVGGWARFAPLLGPLLGLPIPETELTASLAPEQRHERLHDLVSLLCQAVAARQPLALIVDDLHWVDASSLALLARLADDLRDQPFLLLLITRPTPDTGEPWRAWAGDALIPLGDLDSSASELLLTDLLEDSPPQQLRALLERVHGTPFFIEEMVRYLQDTGTLSRDQAGRWVYRQRGDDMAVPSQIEQLILARLDRIDPAARAALEVAAVIGQRCPRPLLEAVAAASGGGARLDDALGLLQDEAILLPDVEDGHPSYQFKLMLTRDVTYGSISYARRALLHTKVVEALEEQRTGDPDALRVEIAEHYTRAGLHGRAYPLLLRAAALAEARYANREAIDLYRKAIEVAPPSLAQAEVADLHERAGDVLVLIGDLAGARTSYDASYERLRFRTDAASPEFALRRAAVWRKIGRTYEHQGDLDQALRCLGEAAQVLDTAGDTPAAALERARQLSDRGWLHVRRGELAQAQGDLDLALALVEGRAEVDEETRILNRLGGLAWGRGDLPLAQRYVQRSLEMQQQADNLVGQARALNNLGNLSGALGDLRASIDYGLRAMAVNEQVGNRRELAVSANNVGWALYDLGDDEQARRYLLQALDQATAVNDAIVQMQVLLNLGRVTTRLGRWEDAEEFLRRCLDLATQMALTHDQLDCHVALAELWLERGVEAEARRELAVAQSFAAEVESEEYGRRQRLEARVAALDGDVARAAELLGQNIELFEQLPNAPEAQRSRALREALRAGG